LLLDGGEKSVFLEKNKIDDGDADGEILEVDIAKIVRVLFCGDEGNCAGVMSRFDELGGFGSGIAMMIGKGLLSGDGESPVLKVSDEGAGIADAAESVERAGSVPGFVSVRVKTSRSARAMAESGSRRRPAGRRRSFLAGREESRRRILTSRAICRCWKPSSSRKISTPAC
jgi:hypothetical protein